MSILRIKQLGLIFSSISAIFAIIVIVTRFLLNIPYKWIEESLGIKKNSKSEAIIFLIFIVSMFLSFFIINTGIVYSICGGNINESKKTSGLNLSSKIILVHLVITAVLGVISCYINSNFQKNILKYINNKNIKRKNGLLENSKKNHIKIYSYFIKIKDKLLKKLKKKCPKIYFCYPEMFFIVVLIINSLVLVWYLKELDAEVNYYINSLIMLISIILSIMISIVNYSKSRLKIYLISLKNSNVYLRSSRIPIRYGKIIYMNDKYICIYNDSKIIHINNKDILKIESDSL